MFQNCCFARQHQNMIELLSRTFTVPQAAKNGHRLKWRRGGNYEQEFKKKTHTILLSLEEAPPTPAS